MTTVNNYRQRFHLSPPPGFMNDIQSFFHDGQRWHLYYLWNGDHPTPSGSEWRHVTTKDWTNFQDHGVAIPKHVQGLPDKDAATGSVVRDTDNLAGFGKGTLLAYSTTFYQGIQRTNLWYSTDGGYHFTPYAGNPIQANELGLANFRDPYVFIQNGKFYLYMAEQFKVGIYESDNGRQFRYIDEVPADAFEHIGEHAPIECPCLLHAMNVDGRSDQQKAVLIFGSKRPTHNSIGTYYLIGHMEGPCFRAETGPKRLDSGPDFYGARAEPSNASNPSHSAFILGWMSSWEYTNQVPSKGIWGSMSMCRELFLSSQNGYTLNSMPIHRNRLFTWSRGYELDLHANKRRKFNLWNRRAFAISLQFNLDDITEGECGFNIYGNNWRITWHYNIKTQRFNLKRICQDIDQSTISSNGNWKANFNKEADIDLVPYSDGFDTYVSVNVFVDNTSVELFTHNNQVCTFSKFGEEGGNTLILDSTTDMEIICQRRFL